MNEEPFPDTVMLLASTRALDVKAPFTVKAPLDVIPKAVETTAPAETVVLKRSVPVFGVPLKEVVPLNVSVPEVRERVPLLINVVLSKVIVLLGVPKFETKPPLIFIVAPDTFKSVLVPLFILNENPEFIVKEPALIVV